MTQSRVYLRYVVLAIINLPSTPGFSPVFWLL